MKIMTTLVALVFSAQVLAYLPKIKNWKSDANLPQKIAAELIFDHYIQYVWWEDEGYECGGSFDEANLVKADNDEYVVEGYVTMAMDYCAYESMAYYKLVIKKSAGQYKVFELDFQTNR